MGVLGFITIFLMNFMKETQGERMEDNINESQGIELSAMTGSNRHTLTRGLLSDFKENRKS